MHISIMNVWAIVPAAGLGKRMGAATPKQYLPLLGKPVLQITLEILMDVPQIDSIVVALNPEDRYFGELSPGYDSPASTGIERDASSTVNEAGNMDSNSEGRMGSNRNRPALQTTEGGNTRQQSVFNALESVKSRAAADDWALVHDAVRPCVLPSDIENLLSECCDHAVGGLLAMPQDNTIKRADDRLHVAETVDRSVLWQALTPQLFRFGLLHEAMAQACKQESAVTDEASAVELLGHSPLLVSGARHNIKITRESDLALASAILSLQLSASAEVCR